MEHAIATAVYNACYNAEMSMEQFMSSLDTGMKILEEGLDPGQLDYNDMNAANIALRYNAQLMHLLLEEL